MFNSKRFFFLSVIVCIAVIFAGYAIAGIQSSKHDFSISGTSGWSGKFEYGSTGNVVDEICVFCHTPHHAESNVNGLGRFLWNRTNQQLSPNYSMYSSETLSAVLPSSYPTGISLMCMSCHDGVTSIAVGTLSNAPGTGNPLISYNNQGTEPNLSYIGSFATGIDPVIGWGPNIGNAILPGQVINMSNDHPVSFDMDATLLAADPDLQLPNPATYPELAKRLYGVNKRLECSTCHNVHNPDIKPFLVMYNTQSAMCLACHDK